MAKWYVYTLSYPPALEGGAVFYVGKGTGARMHQHEVNAANGEEGKRADVIRGIWDAGHQIVKAKVFETDDEQEAYQAEQRFMLEFKGSLANRRPAPIGRGGRQKNLSFDERTVLELDILLEDSGLSASEYIRQLIRTAHAEMTACEARGEMYRPFRYL